LKVASARVLARFVAVRNVSFSPDFSRSIKMSVRSLLSLVTVVVCVAGANVAEAVVLTAIGSGDGALQANGVTKIDILDPNNDGAIDTTEWGLAPISLDGNTAGLWNTVGGESWAKVFDNGVTSSGFGGGTSKVCCTFSNPSGVQLVSATDTYSISGYTIFSSNDTPSRDPSDWVLEGSNDGLSWTVIDSVVGHTFADSFDADTSDRFEGYEASFAASAYYSNFRFRFTATGGGGFAVQEIELFGTQFVPGPPPAPEPSTCLLMTLGLVGVARFRRRRR
jgi:hypothetical protein